MAPNMFVEANRQASFKPRRRSSVANRSAPAPRWPHQDLKPAQLAEAGFYYIPTPDSHDLVKCFLCDKSLDGWEQGDDPLIEHLRHSKDCGWAMVATAKAQLLEGKKTLPPGGAALTNARAMTFGAGLWPHEGQASGSLNIAKMAEAGFYYTPLKDSADLVSCCFCDISLDGWEVDDDPWAEHSKRSPDCPVIRAGKPKTKGRRTTRTSMLSANAPPAESTEEETRPKAKRGKNKATTAKKPSRKKVEPPSSVESDTEAVKINLPKRGRKRSNSVSREPVVLFDGRADTPENPSPPPKRRVTEPETAPHKPSDNEDEMGEEDTSLLQNAKIQSPKKRLPMQSNSIMSARSKRTMEYDPEGQIVDFDQALSDAEEPSTYQKPFIRQTRRTTRSRTSMMAQEQQLLPTPAARGRTPVATTADPARPPPSSIKKTFFRESGQDFSLPVKVPQHLAEPESPTIARIQPEVEESAPESPPPERKKGRGRPKRAPIKTANDPVLRTRRVKGGEREEYADGDDAMSEHSHVESDTEDGPGEIGESDQTTPRQPALDHMDIDERHYEAEDGDTMSESGSVVRHPQRETHSRDEESAGEEEYQEPEPALAPHRSGDPALSDMGDDPTDDDPVEGFDAEIPDAPSEHPSSRRIVSQALVPFNGPDSSTRRPLSPIRKQVQVAVRTTPRPKQSTSLVTSEPWSPVDLDIVFMEAEGASSFEDGGLSSAEREMTVEEWVKWKAATAEQRLRETAERMVQRFEESGQRALAAIEGIAVQ